MLRDLGLMMGSPIEQWLNPLDAHSTATEKIVNLLASAPDLTVVADTAEETLGSAPANGLGFAFDPEAPI